VGHLLASCSFFTALFRLLPALVRMLLREASTVPAGPEQTMPPPRKKSFSMLYSRFS